MASLPSQEQDWRRTPPGFNPYHLELITSVLAIIMAIFIGRALFQGDDGYWSNVYMTVLGVVITILVLDRQAERRDRQREENDLKAQLIRDAGSTVNDVSRNAVDQLKKREWLRGATGILTKAKLHKADMDGANLSGAKLTWADLTGANLSGVNLIKANMSGANLNGANLHRAKLHGANLYRAKFNERTILPNGTMWTPDADLTKFTNPPPDKAV